MHIIFYIIYFDVIISHIDVSSEGHISYIPCQRCICTKPNAYGI